MAIVKKIQTNFTAGVLDPKLAAREDIVFYYNALKSAENLEVLPQGGVRQRRALQFARELSPVLQAIDLGSATFTAPEGGTAANAKDGSEATVVATTNTVSTTNPYVVLHVDHGTAKTVSAVDIVDYKLSSGALAGEFRVQYSTDNSAWVTYGAPFDWDASVRSRRLRNASGAVTARYWRVARIGATSLSATCQVAELRFWSNGTTLSEGKLFPFAFSTQEAYMLVASDKNMDVLKGRDYHGAISIPHISAQLAKTSVTQSLDTMLVFHGSVPTQRIFRQGGDDEFDWRRAVFTNIPKYDYGAGVGGVDEVQSLNDGGLLASGDDFTILLEGSRTKTITVGASRAATATAIQTALRALPNTGNGITVADDAGTGFLITFAGEDGKKPWNEMNASVMSGSAVITFSRTVKGQPEGEDIMSDTRGHPRHGVFHQSRLHMVGIPGVPDAWLASVLDDYYNLNTDIDDDTRAILFRAENDQVSAIYHVIVGRHLSFFTNDGEFYNPAAKIDKEAFLRFTTDAGSKEGMRVFRVEGSLIFIQGVQDEDGNEIGTSIREFIYDEAVQTYRTNLLSKLSGHLVKNPVDVGLQKSVATGDPNILIIVNEDGAAGHHTILREDDVNALMPITLNGPGRTKDKIKAVGVDKKRRVYFITERLINGEARRFVEIANDKLYLDCGGIVTMTAEVVTAAADAQANFIWSFSNPPAAGDIGVRLNGGRLEASEYSVNLGTKTVSLVSSLASAIKAGDQVRICILVDTVSGVPHLEGETIQTFVDGTPGKDVVVSGGSFTLSIPADTEIQYGFDFNVSLSLMPYREPESQTLAAEKIRCVNLILNFDQTIGAEIRANEGRWQDVPLARTDENVLDRSAMELLFTGEVKKQALSGLAVGAPVDIRRPCPGPFTLLSVTREVSL